MSIPPSYLAIGMGGHFEGFVGCGEAKLAGKLQCSFRSQPTAQKCIVSNTKTTTVYDRV